MQLYLVQHAMPVSKDQDPERPLAEAGKRALERLVAFAAANCRIEVQHLFHSGKTRARQTAEYLARGLGLPEPVQGDDLTPLADPAIWAELLREGADDVMLVGHLPHLNRLASLLLCDDPEAGLIRFEMGGVVALTEEDARWSVAWMLVPRILPA